MPVRRDPVDGAESRRPARVPTSDSQDSWVINYANELGESRPDAPPLARYTESDRLTIETTLAELEQVWIANADRLYGDFRIVGTVCVTDCLPLGPQLVDGNYPQTDEVAELVDIAALGMFTCARLAIDREEFVIDVDPELGLPVRAWPTATSDATAYVSQIAGRGNVPPGAAAAATADDGDPTRAAEPGNADQVEGLRRRGFLREGGEHAC